MRLLPMFNIFQHRSSHAEAWPSLPCSRGEQASAITQSGGGREDPLDSIRSSNDNNSSSCSNSSISCCTGPILGNLWDLTPVGKQETGTPDRHFWGQGQSQSGLDLPQAPCSPLNTSSGAAQKGAVVPAVGAKEGGPQWGEHPARPVPGSMWSWKRRRRQWVSFVALELLCLGVVALSVLLLHRVFESEVVCQQWGLVGISGPVALPLEDAPHRSLEERGNAPDSQGQMASSSKEQWGTLEDLAPPQTDDMASRGTVLSPLRLYQLTPGLSSTSSNTGSALSSAADIQVLPKGGSEARTVAMAESLVPMDEGLEGSSLATVAARVSLQMQEVLSGPLSPLEASGQSLSSALQDQGHESASAAKFSRGSELAPLEEVRGALADVRRAVQALAEKHGRVVVTQVNVKVKARALEWYRAASSSGHGHEALLIADDDAAYRFLKQSLPNQTLHCSDFLQMQPVGAASQHSQSVADSLPAGLEQLRRRTIYLKVLLQMNVTVLFTEVDYPWHEDPLDLPQAGFEAWAQEDTRVVRGALKVKSWTRSQSLPSRRRLIGSQRPPKSASASDLCPSFVMLKPGRLSDEVLVAWEKKLQGHQEGDSIELVRAEWHGALLSAVAEMHSSAGGVVTPRDS